MAKISVNLGDAFLIDTPPAGQHLYIAIAKTSSDKYLFVNVTTRRPSSEAVCVLTPGADVPNFIKRESVIDYRFARELTAEQLAKVITPNSPIPKGMCSADVLRQIQEGGLASMRLANGLKEKLRVFLGRQ